MSVCYRVVREAREWCYCKKLLALIYYVYFIMSVCYRVVTEMREWCYCQKLLALIYRV